MLPEPITQRARLATKQLSGWFIQPGRFSDFVDGQETDAWGLKDGMNISATAVTKTPETVVSEHVKRTGTMPRPTPEPPRQGGTLLIIVAASR